MFEMDLQLFSDEGVDNSVDTVDNSEETPSEEFGAGVEEETTEQPETPQELDYKPFLESLSGKMKYNGEAVEVDSIENLIAGYQKSLNYDKINSKVTDYEEKISQLDPQVQFAQTMAKKYGYDNVLDYQAAVEEQWKKDEIDTLIQNNIPEEYAKEMIENRQFRDQYSKEQQTTQEKQAEDKRYTDFIDWHGDMVKNGVFTEGLDVEKIPGEVWNILDRNGDQNIKAAYMEFQLTKQRGDIQQETLKNIQHNSETSTGAINSQTSQEPAIMSNEQVDSLLAGMTSNERGKWIDSNMNNLEKWGYFKNF